MTIYSSNYELAQEISARLGTEPIPFDSVLSLCHEIYTELGGDEEQFDNVYEILLEILPLARQNRFVAGSGITISGNTIASNTDSTVKSQIQLSNGAPINALGIWENDVIPSGESVQSVLTKLLCRETFPNSATLPDFTVEGSALGVKEFNTTVEITEPSTTKSDGKFNASFSTPSQPSVSGVTWSNETVSISITGFTGDTSTKTVVLGSNVIEYTFSKDYSAPSNMPITNLNHPTQSTTKISTDGSDITAIWTSGTVSHSASITATGVYPCFTNISNSTLTTDAETKCSLTSGKELVFNNVPSEEVAGKHFKFAFPVGRTVEFKVKDLSNNFVPYSATYITETVENFYRGIDYVVLTTTGDKQGIGTYKMILSKNLSE